MSINHRFNGSRLSQQRRGINMHRMLCALLIACISCGHAPQRNVRYSEVSTKGITSFSTPGELRLAFMRETVDDKGKPLNIYCAEPVPDVALGSELSGNGSLGLSNALTAASSLNSELSRENQELRRQLDKVVDEYERDTQREYKTSFRHQAAATSNLTTQGSINLTAAAKLAVSVSELGGRSQQVLLAREFLYRLCEARANNFITKSEQYMTLQVAALSMIQTIYASQRSSTAAEEATAYAEILKQVNAYNERQGKVCETQKSVCIDTAPKGSDGKPKPDELNKCNEDHKKCVHMPLLQPPNPPKKVAPEKTLLENVQESYKTLTQ